MDTQKNDHTQLLKTTEFYSVILKQATTDNTNTRDPVGVTTMVLILTPPSDGFTFLMSRPSTNLISHSSAWQIAEL